MLSDTYTVALNSELMHNAVMHSIMLGSAANFNMLYHSGYTSGIYR
jgi:hypothetical protein